jgi:hypothetical protein
VSSRPPDSLFLSGLSFGSCPLLHRQHPSSSYIFRFDSESVRLARDGRHWNASEDVIAGLSFAVNTRPPAPRRGTRNSAHHLVTATFRLDQLKEFLARDF